MIFLTDRGARGHGLKQLGRSHKDEGEVAGGSGTLPTIPALSEWGSEHEGTGEGLRDGVGGRGVVKAVTILRRFWLEMAVRPSWPLPDRLARAPRVGALFFGDKAVLVSCSPASSVQPLTDFLVAKQKCVSFPICFSPPGMGSDCGRASCSHVGRLSPVSVLKMCRHQRAEERPRRKNKERQRRGRRGLHRGPSPRPNSTCAGPAACGARSAPARPHHPL